MKIQFASKAAASALLALAGSASFAQTVTLATVNSFTTGTYGDFSVQSLELNEACKKDNNINCNPPGGPYPVQASPGQISDYLIIAQGNSTANNFPPLTTQTGDNGFSPSQGPQNCKSLLDATCNFDFNAASEPNSGPNTALKNTPDFTGDQIGTWEVQLGTLLNYLTHPNGVGKLVFMFQNNQAGDGLNQFQDIFATASIRDQSGAYQTCVGLFTPIGSSHYGGGTCEAPTPTEVIYDSVNGGVTDSGNFVPIATNFCVDKVTGASYNIGTAKNDNSCKPDGTHTSGGYYIVNNGSNATATFAAWNDQLNQAFLAAVADPTKQDWVLSVNIKFRNLTDGAESVWICSDCDATPITHKTPEPGTLALLGLAFAGLGLTHRRRRA